MTSSKSDLEAKEGQIPNESNFLEFVSLLGSLSTRGGVPSTQEEEGLECKEEVGTTEEGEFQLDGSFLYCPSFICMIHRLMQLFMSAMPRLVNELHCSCCYWCVVQYNHFL